MSFFSVWPTYSDFNILSRGARGESNSTTRSCANAFRKYMVCGWGASQLFICETLSFAIAIEFCIGEEEYWTQTVRPPPSLFRHLLSFASKLELRSFKLPNLFWWLFFTTTQNISSTRTPEDNLRCCESCSFCSDAVTQGLPAMTKCQKLTKMYSFLPQYLQLIAHWA